MNDTTAPSEHKTQGIEVTKEMIDTMIESVMEELLLHFHGEQAAVSLETSGRWIIARGLNRALAANRVQAETSSV